MTDQWKKDCFFYLNSVDSVLSKTINKQLYKNAPNLINIISEVVVLIMQRDKTLHLHNSQRICCLQSKKNLIKDSIAEHCQ